MSDEEKEWGKGGGRMGEGRDKGEGAVMGG
jgi:hypothetical protein